MYSSGHPAAFDTFLRTQPCDECNENTRSVSRFDDAIETIAMTRERWMYG